MASKFGKRQCYDKKCKCVKPNYMDWSKYVPEGYGPDFSGWRKSSKVGDQEVEEKVEILAEVKLDHDNGVMEVTSSIKEPGKQMLEATYVDDDHKALLELIRDDVCQQWYSNAMTNYHLAHMDSVNLEQQKLIEGITTDNVLERSATL